MNFKKYLNCHDLKKLKQYLEINRNPVTVTYRSLVLILSYFRIIEKIQCQ